MNKRHYEHTLPNIRGSLSNTYKKVIGNFILPYNLFSFIRSCASPEERRQNYIAKGVAFTYALYPLIMPGNPSSARGR